MARNSTFEIRSENPRRCQNFNEVHSIEAEWTRRTEGVCGEHIFLSSLMVEHSDVPGTDYNVTRDDLLVFNKGAPITVLGTHLLVQKEYKKTKLSKMYCDEEPVLSRFFPGYILYELGDIFFFECLSVEEERQHDFYVI